MRIEARHGLSRLPPRRGAAPVMLMAALLLLAPTSASAEERVIDTEIGKIKVETLASGLEHPWGLAFLPDGRMLVTERTGHLRILTGDGALSDPLAGVPEVVAKGQGGLLDVAIGPKFNETKFVYLSFAEAGPSGASTAVARGRLYR